MVVYLIMLSLSLIFTAIGTKIKNRNLSIVMYVLASLPFFIVSAIRYDVGTDYNYRYVGDFNKIANGLTVDNLEIGFVILIKFCLLFTTNSQWLFVITSALITFFIMFTIFKYSKIPIVSIAIFFFGGFFFQSLNMIRQFLAMSIILFGYKYLLERKKVPLFLLSLVIAFFIHSSSIVMIVILLLKNRYIMKPFVILPIIAVIFLFKDDIIRLISIVVENTRFNVYLVGLYAKGEISYFNIITNLAIYFYMNLCYKIKKKNGQIVMEDKLFLNIQALATICMCMTILHMLFARIAYYFIIFQIISIPYFIGTTEIREIHIGKKWTKRIICALILICFILTFSYTNVLNNDNKPLPYKTIFNKEKEFM